MFFLRISTILHVYLFYAAADLLYSWYWALLPCTQLRKRYEGFGLTAMLPNKFLHPDHIMPLVQLPPALVKMCHGLKAMPLMKAHASRIGVSDAGV